MIQYYYLLLIFKIENDEQFLYDMFANNSNQNNEGKQKTGYQNITTNFYTPSPSSSSVYVYFFMFLFGSSI